MIRNDAITPTRAEALAPSHLVISPGPGRPEDAGATPAISAALRARTDARGLPRPPGDRPGLRRRDRRARELVHGKATIVEHDGRGIFAGLPDDFLAGRYHSLAATSVPDCFEVSATAIDGEVMAVRHRELPLDGVQFHPESVLTPLGRDIARNFLQGGGR